MCKTHRERKQLSRVKKEAFKAKALQARSLIYLLTGASAASEGGSGAPRSEFCGRWQRRHCPFVCTRCRFERGARPSVHPSIHPSIYPSIHLSICLSARHCCSSLETNRPMKSASSLTIGNEEGGPKRRYPEQ